MEKLHEAIIGWGRAHAPLVRTAQCVANNDSTHQFAELRSNLGNYYKCVSNLNQAASEVYHFSDIASKGVHWRGHAGFLTPATIFFTYTSCFRLPRESVEEEILQDNTRDCCEIAFDTPCLKGKDLPDIEYESLVPDNITPDELEKLKTMSCDGSFRLDS